jgi:hypothetical protein
VRYCRRRFTFAVISIVNKQQAVEAGKEKSSERSIEALQVAPALSERQSIITE